MTKPTASAVLAQLPAERMSVLMEAVSSPLMSDLLTAIYVATQTMTVSPRTPAVLVYAALPIFVSLTL
jgi:hypothetical protein